MLRAYGHPSGWNRKISVPSAAALWSRLTKETVRCNSTRNRSARTPSPNGMPPAVYKKPRRALSVLTVRARVSSGHTGRSGCASLPRWGRLSAARSYLSQHLLSFLNPPFPFPPRSAGHQRWRQSSLHPRAAPVPLHGERTSLLRRSAGAVSPQPRVTGTALRRSLRAIAGAPSPLTPQRSPPNPSRCQPNPP